MDSFSVICSILIAICMIGSTASSNRQRRWASILPERLDQERLQRASNIFVPSKIDDPRVTFMEDVPEYPERRLKDILLKEGSLHKDLFGTESLIATYDNVHLRSGMQPETQLCESRVEIVYPKKAENKEGKWKFIVNLEDENHKQGVRVERCMDIGESYKMSSPVSLLLTSFLVVAVGVSGKLVGSKFSPPKDVCGEEKVMCDKVPNYPVEEVISAIKSEEDKHSQWFGTVPEFFEEKLMSRLGGTEIQLCPSNRQLIYPQAGQTRDGKMRLIVNDGQAYFQGLWVEVCQNQNSECAFSANFPMGYTTKCEQKYVLKQMVAMDEDGSPVTDYFKVPSCCSCTVSRSTNR